MPARISSVGLTQAAEFMEDQPRVAKRAARLSINDTTRRRVVPDSRREMQKQVAFPTGYLKDKRRFGIRKLATEADLEAVVSARFRPTSLARFATGSQTIQGARRRGGIRVSVNRGGAKFLRRAFFVRLRRGQDTSDGFNLGLAVRLRPGERLRGRRKGSAGVMLDENVALLYGPSVDQVFRDVSTTESPRFAQNLEREFLRQYVRLSSSTR